VSRTEVRALELRGFYAVLDRDDEWLARKLIDGGACIVQVRVKTAGAGELARIATMVKRLGAKVIVNDRVDVAIAVCADGVHLGQTDLPLVDARKLVGARMAIGISTHSVEQVERAVAGGADYLGFGPIFATTTKQNPDPVQGIAGLRAAVATARGVPIVAIGGITPQTVTEVYASGASAACAIGAVNGAPDVVLAARRMAG
jgi:thiamine-phosphate pyrophosphorylase